MKYVQIKDLGKIITGNTPKTSDLRNYEAKDINFIKPSDIVSFNYIEKIKNSEYFISEYARKNARIVPRNTVLVTCIGIIGKVAVTDKEVAFNQQINAIIPDIQKVDPLYLAYAISAKRKYIHDKANAAVVPIINKTNFSSLKIKLFSLTKQKEIVSQLDELDNIISLICQQLTKLDELVKSRFIEMFGDPVTNPMGWEVKTIGEIASDVKYGTSAKASDSGKYKYLRMNNLTYDGYLDLSDLKFIDVSEDELEKYVVRKGDVLFNRTNSTELVGKTAFFDFDEDMIIAGYIIRVRLNEAVSPVFFTRFMNMEFMKKQLRSMAKGAVNQANINAQELKAIVMYVPPIALQNQFADFVALADKSKLVAKALLERCELLREKLMQDYFC